MQETIQKTLLIVDDDAETRELLARYLKDHGFDVVTAANGKEMEICLEHHTVALIVLDLMMPGEDGLHICRRLRSSSNIPIIILTAKGEAVERIIGLEMGADDYLSKPFSPRELVARIRAVLWRVNTGNPAEDQSLNDATYRFSGWTLKMDERTLLDPAGKPVELSSGELSLLQIFIQNPRRVLNRDQILDQTRGREFTPFDRSVDVQVSRLRKKLKDRDESADLIKTVHGAGYVFSSLVSRS